MNEFCGAKRRSPSSPTMASTMQKTWKMPSFAQETWRTTDEVDGENHENQSIHLLTELLRSLRRNTRTARREEKVDAHLFKNIVGFGGDIKGSTVIRKYSLLSRSFLIPTFRSSTCSHCSFVNGIRVGQSCFPLKPLSNGSYHSSSSILLFCSEVNLHFPR